MNIYEYQKLIEKIFRRFSFFGVICLLVLSSFEFARAEAVAPRAISSEYGLTTICGRQSERYADSRQIHGL